MESITINIPAPEHSPAGHAIYALASVIRLIAWAADHPKAKGSTAQDLLFVAAKVILANPDIHPGAAELMKFLMTPVDAGPKGKTRSKKSGHLKAV